MRGHFDVRVSVRDFRQARSARGVTGLCGHHRAADDCGDQAGFHVLFGRPRLLFWPVSRSTEPNAFSRSTPRCRVRRTSSVRASIRHQSERMCSLFRRPCLVEQSVELRKDLVRRAAEGYFMSKINPRALTGLSSVERGSEHAVARMDRRGDACRLPAEVLEFPWGYAARFQGPDGNLLQIREGRGAFRR